MSIDDLTDIAGRATAASSVAELASVLRQLRRREASLRQGPDVHDGQSGIVAEGERDEALALAEQGLEIEAEYGRRRTLLAAIHFVAHIYIRMERWEDAMAMLTEAVRDCRQLDDPGLTGRVLNSLGEAHCGVGEHARALECHREAFELSGRRAAGCR